MDLMNDLNQNELRQLIEKLNALRSEMIELESSLLADQKSLYEGHCRSARNLAHYLALRRHDIRQVQAQLAALGLSSLGRTESHVLDTVDAVLTILRNLAGEDVTLPIPREAAIGIGEGTQLLERNTDDLLGPCPANRRVRIMVTMPPEAATDYEFVRDLLLKGMNCMRINCAHDKEEIWSGMIRNLQKAREETGKSCRILMDLAGPKLRTGPIEPGLAVIKCRPKRDELGRVVTPARVWLASAEKMEAPPSPADACLPIPAAFLSRLRRGDTITFRDARRAHRSMKVVSATKTSCSCALSRTAYFVPGTEFRVKPSVARKAPRSSVSRARLGSLPKKNSSAASQAGGHPAPYSLDGARQAGENRQAKSHGKSGENRRDFAGIL